MSISTDANSYVNDSSVELAWAIKAYEHAETYFNLISSLDCSDLNFTGHDNEIYEKYKSEMDTIKIDVLNIDELKSSESKEKWRPFCESFKGVIEDYNFGTLLRLDATKGISDDNTTLVPRIQFWAIEIARNREGLNRHLITNQTNR
ncbi:protein PBDC1-like isoform X1 [Xenia sp. Carnegie-2017]|uniref:protein PBDC1-like isoform X1 n=1 Tax=Xenia sp. Carnegie-2017 TaxID=2897299 RepID=UPI001F039456|nr:protein PBDC1-like isoform X1 [Xenia sp. Carnegie-2017]